MGQRVGRMGSVFPVTQVKKGDWNGSSGDAKEVGFWFF